ncbi:MAG: EAL domain-containing protein, partial [Beijerinckiaceae bacterium]|nr:EAL domain-containing protein [Beijerinckiaceae bacterium]
MVQFTQFLSYFSIASIDPEVAQSQAKAFQKQIPLLYTILSANMVTLAYTYYGRAPSVLTVTMPLVFIAVAVTRVFFWRQIARTEMTKESALFYLRTNYAVVCGLAPLMTGWALWLYPYGDAYEKAHVAFFMSITVIGCIFCLMHLRPAALMLTLIVGIPFTIRFLMAGNIVLAAIALNFWLVLLIMVYILFRYYNDFTALVHSQKHLAALNDLNFKMANNDSLTDLPNRRSFFRDLEAALSQAAKDGTVCAFGLIDLDGFKPVNDVLGHSAGDRVLIEVGRRIRETLGPSALVARLGGDEFGFLLFCPPGCCNLPFKAAAVCAAIRKPIQMPNAVAQVAASIGLAYSSPGGSAQSDLLEGADYALHYAKANQRGTAVVFSAQHETAIRVQSRIEQELRKADFNAEMSLKFQPIVDSMRNQTLAYEALARWDSPVLGPVAPSDFIAAAERTGLINPLTEVLFAKALAALKTWPARVSLSFNLSACDIASRESIERIGQMVEKSGFAPRRIYFEITETALIHDFTQATERLSYLRRLGARISLDDFGTGYSSLNYIHRIPLDKVKVDRSFVAGLTTDQASRDIVRSIVELCRNLKLPCIIEGVETIEQVIILRSIGCMIMQGF